MDGSGDNPGRMIDTKANHVPWELCICHPATLDLAGNSHRQIMHVKYARVLEHLPRTITTVQSRNV